MLRGLARLSKSSFKLFSPFPFKNLTVNPNFLDRVILLLARGNKSSLVRTFTIYNPPDRHGPSISLELSDMMAQADTSNEFKTYLEVLSLHRSRYDRMTYQYMVKRLFWLMMKLETSVIYLPDMVRFPLVRRLESGERVPLAFLVNSLKHLHLGRAQDTGRFPTTTGKKTLWLLYFCQLESAVLHIAIDSESEKVFKDYNEGLKDYPALKILH